MQARARWVVREGTRLFLFLQIRMAPTFLQECTFLPVTLEAQPIYAIPDPSVPQKHQEITWRSLFSTQINAQKGGRGWRVEHTMFMVQWYLWGAVQVYQGIFFSKNFSFPKISAPCWTSQGDLRVKTMDQTHNMCWAGLWKLFSLSKSCRKCIHRIVTWN